ncbi:GNAT domain-containing protein [Immersiella caudata]|uniref:GNAT domain-containing protein n=1 Tax=Immersiella caudata TaxID=314043 RepID=A0AA39X3E5_9PEZI|nr:GNAT domain-containing protein [Immersiella caudata]
MLVPYEHRHVLKYHTWMEDPAIQQATASDRLTLEEEYENQESWRASHDKLTFIICQPLADPGTGHVKAGDADADGKMVGDVNFFVYPDDDDDDSEDGCVGEVDIMIADVKDRGKGIGKGVVMAFLQYIFRNLESVLDEYARAQDGERKGVPKLKMLMVKIKAENMGSIKLFQGLGFSQEGDVNYFGEVKLVLREFGRVIEAIPEGYLELQYARGGDDAVARETNDR